LPLVMDNYTARIRLKSKTT